MSAVTVPTRGEEALGVSGLVQHFSVSRAWTDRLLKKTPPEPVKAVDGVSFSLAQGETLGLVGESGCGKSTLSRAIMGLYRPTSGEIRYGGTPVQGLPNRQQRRETQMVFQDPYSSLNPRMTVGQMLGELLRYHQIVPKAKVEERSRELMDLVGLPEDALGRRPRQFSGGQRQRVGIARALALEPKVLIADEAVSALDVSVQATIINLLVDLKASLDLSMIFVSHNMAVVRQVSDRVAVMYRGRIVEIGSTQQVFEEPAHPYTRLLLGSVPRMLTTPHAAVSEGTADPLAVVDGEPEADESPYSAHTVEHGEGPGCRFRPRCTVAMQQCVQEPGLLSVLGTTEHSAACWHVEDPETVGGAAR
ncbi:ABC transporter ATP-binding protein [Nocardioides sp. LHG3406-4]|uniref:ABC transporter ATP-binding protein n=1 Tax=Nocardioides sp. LHG3406-4 TaxID=2804575 RepID=UPI003CEF594A